MDKIMSLIGSSFYKTKIEIYVIREIKNPNLPVISDMLKKSMVDSCMNKNKIWNRK